jgi:Ser/Thr protein kinase RdoA (MazF antagonist)
VGAVEATHAAFRVRAGDASYLLRQFNPYLEVDDLRAQFRLAELMDASGLRTPRPIRTREREPFVAVQGRLWALFPWCEGRSGSGSSHADLMLLAAAQGAWIEQSQRLPESLHWDSIVCSAWKFRQRKSWAWVVPLDRVPQFATRHRVLETARRANLSGPHGEAFLPLLDQVEAGLHEFAELLAAQRVDALPHAITHGDFWASNLQIGEDGVNVLDLDCFTYEPRVTDFARAANWYHKQHTPPENAALFARFQGPARLTAEEREALPLMMCAHDLYYAVGHVLLFLEEQEATARSRLLDSITSEAQAARRYRREREAILSTFLSDNGPT